MPRLIFMGSPEIAVPSLQALVQAGHEITSVVTQPDRPKGRGQHLSAPAVKIAAKELDLPILQPQKVRDPHFVEQLARQKPDAIVVVAYGQILSKEILQIPDWGCVNVHFSLLPKYRGAACVAYALMNGDDETGVTTMLMGEGLDTGPILMQWTEAVKAEDTTETISERLSHLGAKQIVDTLSQLEQGKLKPMAQDEAQVSLAPRLKKAQGHVDWTQNAETIYHQYQGLTPWPGLYGFLNNKRLRLTQLKRSKIKAIYPAGTLRMEDDQLYIYAHRGRLEIIQLQPEGKKVLSAQDFVRGLHSKDDLILK